MSVKRFRNVALMTLLEARPFDPDNLRVAFELAQVCFGLGGKHRRPGVYKYRSAEAAWEAELRRERGDE